MNMLTILLDYHTYKELLEIDWQKQAIQDHELL